MRLAWTGPRARASSDRRGLQLFATVLRATAPAPVAAAAGVLLAGPTGRTAVSCSEADSYVRATKIECMIECTNFGNEGFCETDYVDLF